MTPLFAHVAGLPIEETAATLIPVGVAIMAALRASAGRIWRRRK
ncbi:MAG TPA: hypothetical protein VNB64_13885 [Solirubrobacteraceae bacterium]|nr:hypothetical protein [Solirubrobacteraceae bacterium]